MQPTHVRRALFLALVAVSATHCRTRGNSIATPRAADPSPPPNPSGGPYPYLLAPAEAAAYRRGREREITLLRDALIRHQSLSPVASITAGAAAAGLPVDGYRSLVARVDSGLRMRAAAAPADSSGPGRAEWAELDSLRVELTVLRSRLDAVGTGTP